MGAAPEHLVFELRVHARSPRRSREHAPPLLALRVAPFPHVGRGRSTGEHRVVEAERRQ